MNNRQLQELSQQLHSKTAAEVDQALQRRHLDVVERLAVKLQLQASAAGRTVRAGSGLATDTADYQRPRNEIDRLLDRVGVEATRQYTEAQLTELMQAAGLDAERRIAVRLECQARGLTREASEADRMLRHLGIDKPITLTALERLLDQRGVASVTSRTCVRAELQQRGWLQGGGNRTMRASADRGVALVDRRGRAITLRSHPE